MRNSSSASLQRRIRKYAIPSASRIEALSGSRALRLLERHRRLRRHPRPQVAAAALEEAVGRLAHRYAIPLPAGAVAPTAAGRMSERIESRPRARSGQERLRRAIRRSARSSRFAVRAAAAASSGGAKRAAVAAATNCSGSTANSRRKRAPSSPSVALRGVSIRWSTRNAVSSCAARGGDAARVAPGAPPQPNAGLGQHDRRRSGSKGGEQEQDRAAAVVAAAAEAQRRRAGAAGEAPIGAEPVDRPQLLLGRRRVLRRGASSARPPTGPTARFPSRLPPAHRRASRVARRRERPASGRTGASRSP